MTKINKKTQKNCSRTVTRSPVRQLRHKPQQLCLGRPAVLAKFASTDDLSPFCVHGNHTATKSSSMELSAPLKSSCALLGRIACIESVPEGQNMNQQRAPGMRIGTQIGMTNPGENAARKLDAKYTRAGRFLPCDKCTRGQRRLAARE